MSSVAMWSSSWWSSLRLAARRNVRPCLTSGGGRRASSTLGFKPGEQARHVEAVAKRDLTLYRYEDPGRVRWKNLLGLAMLPVWTYMAKVSWGLRDLEAYSDNVGDRKWVLQHVLSASRGVAVGFFLFGN